MQLLGLIFFHYILCYTKEYFGDAMFLSGHQPQEERDREIAELEASHQTEES